jgi:uncharacterized membrane protein YfcA
VEIHPEEAGVIADLASFLAIGAIVGFFAGLLGIGGGTIIVSSLALTFIARGFPAQHVMHMAVGTSLAAIVAGAFASFRAHDRHGAVDWPTVKATVPGIIVGVFAGAAIARYAGNTFLKYFFLAFLALVIAQMVFGLRPRPSRELPGRGALTALALVIGVSSSLFGGGAAAVGVPFLTWCNMSTHRAIGTVAAMGFPVAIAGTIGYAVAGWDVAGLPPWTVGFIYVPAFVGISATSMLLAPWGAKLAHRLKGATLRRIFAVFLLAIGAKIAISV